ncbi:hypothetical protein [Cohnella sp. CFH 77786]|nr:hypothetical protein [Cohnella sp. CFH 77786]
MIAASAAVNEVGFSDTFLKHFDKSYPSEQDGATGCFGKREGSG